jgi:hypothetical protein
MEVEVAVFIIEGECRPAQVLVVGERGIAERVVASLPPVAGMAFTAASAEDRHGRSARRQIDRLRPDILFLVAGEDDEWVVRWASAARRRDALTLAICSGGAPAKPDARARAARLAESADAVVMLADGTDAASVSRVVSEVVGFFSDHRVGLSFEEVRHLLSGGRLCVVGRGRALRADEAAAGARRAADEARRDLGSDVEARAALLSIASGEDLGAATLSRAASAVARPGLDLLYCDRLDPGIGHEVEATVLSISPRESASAIVTGA